MTGCLSSAPGKVMLAGEYAVLFGAPAIVAAVDLRASVRVRAASSVSTLVTQGYRDGCFPFRIDDAGRLYLDKSAGTFPLFESALATCRPDWPGAVDVHLDTRRFSDSASGEKYGLGSSAALSVALAAALIKVPSSANIMAAAERCHRRFQGGQGSGADIAAATCGGIIEYRADTTPIPLEWPQILQARLFWSGQSASTAGKIRRLQESLRGARTDKTITLLAARSEEVLSAWRANDELLSTLHRYNAALRDFDGSHALGIFAAGHARLSDRAAEFGFVYKPCGAGGGDIGALFAPAGACLAEFEASAAERGFQALDFALGADGVTVRNE